ncbi:MAG TPA: response regulator transcription factor [Thermoanaerobaculia bacterium]|nr:response regulator transcription factor [Thermoanaerobaculia bacterium]
MGTARADSGPGARKLRLAILEHHQLFRECLATALAEMGSFDVQPLAGLGHAPVDRLAELEVDVLLLGLDGVKNETADLVRELTARQPRLAVVLIGSAQDEGRMVDCLEAGAAGCVFPEQSLTEVCTAIESVARGEAVLPPRLAGTLFARLADLGRERRRRERLSSLALTPREFEILRLVAEGLSNEEIARRLFLSIHTVKNHVHKILETLGVASRWDAAQLAITRGWLPDRRRGDRASPLTMNPI